MNLKGNALTGDYSLETLRNTMNSVYRAVDDYDPYGVNNGSMIYKPVYAISVVSHGVNLEEWDFMVFQDLPYSTSQYIQDLSRFGRKNLGIVMLRFYPNRVREDSFYRNFTRHGLIDRSIVSLFPESTTLWIWSVDGILLKNISSLQALRTTASRQVSLSCYRVT